MLRHIRQVRFGKVLFVVRSLRSIFCPDRDTPDKSTKLCRSLYKFFITHSGRGCPGWVVWYGGKTESKSLKKCIRIWDRGYREVLKTTSWIKFRAVFLRMAILLIKVGRVSCKDYFMSIAILRLSLQLIKFTKPNKKNTTRCWVTARALIASSWCRLHRWVPSPSSAKVCFC